MNTFSSWSQPETITSRLAAVLAVLVLASLPAVAKASPDIHLDLFSGAEVEPLSSLQMAETQGQWQSGSDLWEVRESYGDQTLTLIQLGHILPFDFWITLLNSPGHNPFVQPWPPADPLCISAACLGNVGF